MTSGAALNVFISNSEIIYNDFTNNEISNYLQTLLTLHNEVALVSALTNIH